MRLDPFSLFPMTTTAVLSQPAAPGLEPTHVADIRVIVKRSTASDDFSNTYTSRVDQWRFHIAPATLPDEYRDNPELLLGLTVTFDGHRYRIAQASRGDDFTNGDTPFISVQATPEGRMTA